jgi:2,3-diketo-5-methylthio-1-phosphopentane phosphatase
MVRVFIDFDGTVTRDDVGNLFFRTFGGPVCDEYVRRYRAGELSAAGLFRAEAAAIGALDLEASREFLRGCETDPGLPGFVAFCRERGVDLCVVSDGLDYYIGAILERVGCGDVPRVSNRAIVGGPDASGRGRLQLDFPHNDAVCDRCACCKRNVMLTRSADEDVIVYVGDGYSDRCPVQYADLVFAKGDLQTYCREQNISYLVYRSLDDVLRRLSGLLDGKGVKRRRQAMLRRRAVFAAEA